MKLTEEIKIYIIIIIEENTQLNLWPFHSHSQLCTLTYIHQIHQKTFKWKWMIITLLQLTRLFI